MKNLLINDPKLIINPSIGNVGFDVYANSEPTIVGVKSGDHFYSSIQYIEYDTGLKICPDDEFYTLAVPRSSCSNTNLSLANNIGLIDPNYRGTLKFRFKYIADPCDYIIQNNSIILEVNEDKIYKKGDRIGQLFFVDTLIPNLVHEEDFGKLTSHRGENGFGSSGK